MTQQLQAKFVICLNNQGYEASLEVGKLYRLIDDEEAQINGLIRVIDESGEDYAFSAQRFYAVELPQNVEEALLLRSHFTFNHRELSFFFILSKGLRTFN